MAASFTPGPWKVVEYDSVRDAIQDGIDWACERHWPIASVYLDCGNGAHTGLPGHAETTLPNCHLIAAAPDLFNYVESSAQNGCATAIALVAKARGETA